MMMHMKHISNRDITTFFKSDPQLCLTGLSDDNIIFLKEQGKYPDIQGENSFGIYKGDTLLAVTQMGFYTTLVLNIHFYLKSEYQGRPAIMKEVFDVISKFIIDNTSQNKVIIQTPKTCLHVRRRIRALGFRLEGTIQNGICWRGEVVDLLIYGCELEDKGNN